MHTNNKINNYQQIRIQHRAQQASGNKFLDLNQIELNFDIKSNLNQEINRGLSLIALACCVLPLLFNSSRGCAANIVL